MATKVPVPFTGQKIDFGDPTSALMTIGLLVAGFAAFFAAEDLGGSVWQSVSSMIGMGGNADRPEAL